jgi:organic hydroperoxide reductase OsmC/OhrA
MQPYPHHYNVVASGQAGGDIALDGRGLATLLSAAPEEFGGPGDRWSPETLLVAAVADCFVLTFRAVARAAKVEWLSLRCEVDGTLDRLERTAQFVAFGIRATLEVPAGANEQNAKRALERAEQSCLVTRSLKGPVHLDVVINERA